MDQKVGNIVSVTATALDICPITELKETICPQPEIQNKTGESTELFKFCVMSEKFSRRQIKESVACRDRIWKRTSSSGELVKSSSMPYT